MEILPINSEERRRVEEKIEKWVDVNVNELRASSYLKANKQVCRDFFHEQAMFINNYVIELLLLLIAVADLPISGALFLLVGNEGKRRIKEVVKTEVGQVFTFPLLILSRITLAALHGMRLAYTVWNLPLPKRLFTVLYKKALFLKYSTKIYVDKKK